MGYWPKAQRKEIEALLEAFDQMGWAIEKTSYYRVRCPCGDHQRSIHLTPSGPYYVRNAHAWLDRQSCSRGRQGSQDA